MVQPREFRVALQGPITVSYHKENGDWIATALQFDIIGIGKSREEAFSEMSELLTTYFMEVLRSKRPVLFFHPSEASEWNRKEREEFMVVFELQLPPRKPAPPRTIRDIKRLRPYRSSVHSSTLAPLAL